MVSRMRRTAFAALGTLALASSLVLTGCADDEDDDCDSMGTQQRSLHEIALAGSSTGTNFVELPNAASLPNPGSVPFALQASTQADDTVMLADGCDNDDEDD